MFSSKPMITSPSIPPVLNLMMNNNQHLWQVTLDMVFYLKRRVTDEGRVADASILFTVLDDKGPAQGGGLLAGMGGKCCRQYITRAVGQPLV